MSAWTDSQVASFFATLPSSPYLALHYDNPVLGGLGQAEFSGGSYARQACPLSSVSSRAVYNTSPILFQGLLAGTVKYLGLWDAASAGTLRAYINVLPTVTVVGGGQLPLNIGDIAFTF